MSIKPAAAHTVTDAKDQTTTYTYDSMDRLATRKDALNRQETYAYDLAGNLTQFTDRTSRQTTFAYDALNRRIQATYPDATAMFGYDVVGRLVTAQDTAPGAGRIDRTYDVLDRLIQETTAQGTVAYQYDVLGRRTQMTAQGQPPTTYQYDAASRLTRVEQGALAAALGYDAANRRTSLSYSNHTMTSYAYDVASRLTSLTHTGASGLLEALTYTYDAAGNRIRLQRAQGTASLLPEAVASAGYDAANEQIAFAGATLTYDANGNLTSDGTTTYTWDARNRLVGVTGALSGSFTYDALGRRTSKTVNGTTTQYAYDGNDIVAEIGSGVVGANYLRSLTIDEPFIRQSATGEEHYHTDALGSTLVVSDAQGAAGTASTYEPFGTTVITGAASSNPLYFTGREQDAPGLYYYRARYYSPSYQRFFGQDQIVFLRSVNLYLYVEGNPLLFKDPLGLDKDLQWFDIGWSYTFGSTQEQCFLISGCSVQTAVPPSLGASIDFTFNKPPDTLKPINAWVGIGRDFSIGTFFYENPNFGPGSPAFIQQGTSLSIGPSIGFPFGISR